MYEKLNWEIEDFSGLDNLRLYRILQLRFRVFVMEQNCTYLDPDGEDFKALHLQAYMGTELAAYCRLFKAGDHLGKASIGRVAVAPEYRKRGYGHELISKALENIKQIWPREEIAISAQKYLKKFYESHGFVQTSEPYMEAGIEHIRMDLQNN